MAKSPAKASYSAKDITVRFRDPTGKLLLERTIAQLDAPLDLRPKTAVVWMPQPLLHPVDRIIVHIDPGGRIRDRLPRRTPSSA